MRLVKKLGFTLVELSIVLVIIGLLIGGILVAQSMINTAKINGVVRALSQYEVAVTNFQTRYKQLPGDDMVVSAAGNNDGTIGPSIESEIVNFWHALSLGVGLKNKNNANYPVFTNNTAAAPTDLEVPRFNINQEMGDVANLPGLYASNDYIPPGRNYGNYTINYFLYMSKSAIPFSTLATDPNVYDPLRQIDVIAIDQKIDDGVGGTGMVTGYTIGQSTLGQCVADTGNTDDDGYQIYTYGGDGTPLSNKYLCSLRVQFGATNGTKQ